MKTPLNRQLEADYLTRLYELIFDGRPGPKGWRRGFNSGAYFILSHLDDDEATAALERIEREFPDAVAEWQGET